MFREDHTLNFYGDVNVGNGMTKADVRSMVAEGVDTAMRKQGRTTAATRSIY